MYKVDCNELLPCLVYGVEERGPSHHCGLLID